MTGEVFASSSMQGLSDGRRLEPVDPAPRPTRRTFPADYKARIVAEYQAAPLAKIVAEQAPAPSESPCERMYIIMERTDRLLTPAEVSRMLASIPKR